MDTTVVMQTTNQLMSNPVTMVNEMPLDSLFIDMGQSIPEFTEDFDVQPDQVLLPNWDPQNAPNFYIVPSEFITTTTAAPTTTTTTTAFPVTIPTQTISIPVSFSTVNQTQPLQYQVQQQPQQQQQQPLQYQTQQILVPIVYENVNTAVYAQQPHQFHHAAVAVVPSPTYSSPASVVAVAANSPPTMQISYSSSPVSSNNNNKKRRTSNDDSDYDSDAQLSDYDSDLHIGSSPQHHSSGDSGPVKKITKHKRRRSKDAKIKVERNRGACEKHKRDRKRCPLDCPMRTDSPTKRQAKGSATAGSEVAGKSPLVAPQSTSPSMPAVQSEAASMIQQTTFIIEQQQQQLPIQSQQNQLVVA